MVRGAAFAQAGFAALTIVPAGEERFDLSSGITTLPQGGQVVDAERNLMLTGSYIQHKEGEFVEAREVTLEGEFGTLLAESVRLDLAEDTLSAAEVSLTTGTLDVQATTLTLYLEPDIARLGGEVTSAVPAFEAATIVLALERGDSLLQSPYRFQDGPFTLQQTESGGMLYLHAERGENGETFYNPSTTVPAELLEILRPYLTP